LVAAEENGEKLSRRELVINCNLLMVAGNLTTTDLIGNGTLSLLRHPDQLALFKAGDPALVRNAVEEMLRYEPPVTTTGRIALERREIDRVPGKRRGGCTRHIGGQFRALADQDQDG
jgi:cytochrome P450